jgi:hypothetical protein
VEGFNDACNPAQPARKDFLDEVDTAKKFVGDVKANFLDEVNWAQPAQEPDYAYPTIEEYEEITGFKVNDTFRMGWAMARATNDVFKQMEKQNERSI